MENIREVFRIKRIKKQKKNKYPILFILTKFSQISHINRTFSPKPHDKNEKFTFGDSRKLQETP